MSLYANCDREVTVGDLAQRASDGALGEVTEIEGGRPHANVTLDCGPAGISYEYSSTLRYVKRPHIERGEFSLRFDDGMTLVAHPYSRPRGGWFARLYERHTCVAGEDGETLASAVRATMQSDRAASYPLHTFVVLRVLQDDQSTHDHPGSTSP